MKKLVVSLWLLTLLFVVICPISVSAHANVKKSIPQMEAELANPPAQIRIQFTEKINPEVSSASLKDASGKVISVQQTSEDDEWLVLHYAPLATGIYTVTWQVLSVDSHVTEGSFRFAVGVDLPKIRPAETQSLDEVSTDIPEQPATNQTQVVQAVKSGKQPAQPSQKPQSTVANQEVKLTPATKAQPAVSQGTSKPVVQQAAGVTSQTTAPTQADAAQAAQKPVQPSVQTVEQTTEQTVSQDVPQAAESTHVTDQAEPVDLHAHHEQHDHQHNDGGSWVRVIEVTAALLAGGFVYLSCWPRFTQVISESSLPLWKWERVLLGVVIIVFAVCDASHIYGMAQTLSSDSSQFWMKAKGIMVSTWIGPAAVLRFICTSGLLLLAFVSDVCKWKQWGKVILYIGIVVTFPLTSHEMSGAVHAGIPFLSHLLHIACAAVWLGGLAGLVYLSFRLPLPAYTNQLATLFTQFSRQAIWSVAVISISGVVITLLKLHSWQDLLETSYGNMLLWKLGAFAFALILAAISRFMYLPEVTANVVHMNESQATVRSLLWSLRIEFVTAILVVVLAGLLATTAPPM